jgi:hypothetical protein
MNILYGDISADAQSLFPLMSRAIYSQEEIKSRGESRFFINNCPVDILYRNNDFEYEPREYKDLLDNNNEYNKYQFDEISSSISILFKRNSIANLGIKESELSKNRFGFCDRILPLQNTDIKGAIAIRDIIFGDDNVDCGIGFVIIYYILQAKIKVFNIDNSYYRNKLIIQSFSIDEDDMKPPLMYNMVGTHICDANIVIDSKKKILGLIKDLLFRLTTINDVPMITKCSANNNFAIEALQSRQVMKYNFQ